MFSPLAIKRFLAVAVLLCFFLPLSQCSQRAPAEEESNSLPTTSIAVLIPEKELSFKSMDESIFVLGFIWPLLAVALEHYVRNKRGLAAISAAEVAFSSLSIFALGQIVWLYDKVLFGGLLLFFLLFCFLVCSAYTFYHHVVSKSA